MQGDFYLPPCSRPKCNQFLHEMAQASRRLNSKLVLVTQDPPNNSIEESFKRSFLDCAFTILHKCKHFWKGIQPLEQYILRDSSRVMCVTFKKDLRPPYEQTERHHWFFKCLPIHDASTKSNLESFLHLAFETLYSKYPDRKDLEEDKSVKDVTQSFDDMGGPNVFVQWPDLFDSSNPKDIFVLNSFLNITKDSTFEFSNIAKLAQEVKDASLPNLKCFFLKILPKMYSESDVESLAFLSVCDNHQLASAALYLLQLLLLEKHSIRINELVVAEGFLWGKLFTLRQSQRTTGFESFTLFVKLAATYAMVVCDFILTCIKENQLYKANTHLDTIDGRLLPPIQAQDEDIINVCKWLDSFVKDMVRRKCKSYKEMIRNLEAQQEELSGPDEAKLVDQQPPSVQTLVAYQAVKEIFLSMSKDRLELLKHYTAGREEVSNAISEIVFQGLAMFIVFKLKNKAVEDVESFCETAMKLLESKILPQFQNAIVEKGMKVDPLLQIMFFNPNPFIRQAPMMSTDVKVKGKKVQLLTRETSRETLILTEVLRVLYPLLLETEKIDNQKKGSVINWLTYKGKFGNSEARIHLHVPLPQDLKFNQKTTFAADDLFYNEMRMLRKLHYENIIKMYAFQLRCFPQFYILEHHHDLQTVLKNRFKFGQLFDKSKLVGYLLQALKAVEFCHSENIVHRNLTAKSLLMVDDKIVRLSGFHLSLEMTGGEAMGSGVPNTMIPTRWSAPESLIDNKYSVASDVWMFGHLMYEVLTHGGLPYADMEDDKELMNKIKRGEIQLYQHRLIQRAHYDIITKCTKSSQDRPNLQEIKTALEQREGDHMDLFESDKVNYDDFQNGHTASTDHGKGIPANAMYQEDISNSHRVLSAPMVSDTVTKITQEHKYIFKEKLSNMPSRVRVELGKGALQHILPYMNIRESPKEMPHAECIIPRLSNRSEGFGVQLNNQPANVNIDESLEKVSLDKLLGESVKPYLDCMYQIALLLEKLHSESWLIGDLSMPLVHVQRECQGGSLNVYIVSVGYLQKCNSDSGEFSNIDTTEKQSKDPLLVSRAAPEVAESDMFSLGSDIYCFGNLMWQTLKALECPIDMKTSYRKKQMEGAIFEHGKVSEKWETRHSKPNNCSSDLYDLMKKCTQHSSSARISAHELTQQVSRIIQRI